MKSYVLAALLMLGFTAASAQEKDIDKNAIDVGSGATLSFINIYEHPGEKAFSTGIDFSLRYTRFFDEHWGAFIQIGSKHNTVRRDTYFKKVESLDNGRYSYNWFKTGPTTPELSYIGGFAGTVYRYDINRWSLRPRVGLGVTEMYFEKSNYYRTPEDGSDRQAVMIQPAATDEEGDDFFRVLPAGQVGIQFNYSVTKHFHIGADFDMTVFISRHEYTANIYDTKKREAIKDLPSAIIGILLMTPLWLEDYERTDLVIQEKANSMIRPIASIQFSLGWDF